MKHYVNSKRERERERERERNAIYQKVNILFLSTLLESTEVFKKKKSFTQKKKQHIRVGSSQFWIRLQCCKNIYILLKNGRLRLKVKAFKTDDTAY